MNSNTRPRPAWSSLANLQTMSGFLVLGRSRLSDLLRLRPQLAETNSVQPRKAAKSLSPRKWKVKPRHLPTGFPSITIGRLGSRPIRKSGLSWNMDSVHSVPLDRIQECFKEQLTVRISSTLMDMLLGEPRIIPSTPSHFDTKRG